MIEVSSRLRKSWSKNAPWCGSYGTSFGFVVLFCLAITLLAFFSKKNSFGGDFWLHLWLIELQRDSWIHHSMPAFLVSFEPLGLLTPYPLISGGLTYQALGVLGIFGFSSYDIAACCFFLSCLIATSSIFRLGKAFGLGPKGCSLVSMLFFVFAWPFGDGLGRGALSSLFAGAATIAALCELLRLTKVAKVGRNDLFVASICCVLALGTHIPSSLIFVLFGLPTVLFLAEGNKIFPSKKSIRLILSALLPAFLISAVYWLPSVIWSRSSIQGKLPDPFQTQVSQDFGTTTNLFSLQRTVPASHNEIWASWIGPSFDGATSLVITQPTLILIVLLLVLFFRKPSNSIATKSLVLLAFMYLVVNRADWWGFFPQILQSIQFSFRLLYIPIFLCVVWTIHSGIFIRPVKMWRNQRFIVFVFTAFVAFGIAQTINQVNSTTNLSMVTTASETMQWQYDIDPKDFRKDWPKAPYWYASAELRSDDDVLIGESDFVCESIPVSTEWTWPGNRNSLRHSTDADCLKVSLRSPVDWFVWKGVDVRGRDATDLSVIAKMDKEEMRLELALINPIYLGSILSVVGCLVLLSISHQTFRFRRKQSNTISDVQSITHE